MRPHRLTCGKRGQSPYRYVIDPAGQPRVRLHTSERSVRIQTIGRDDSASPMLPASRARLTTVVGTDRAGPESEAFVKSAIERRLRRGVIGARHTTSAVR